MKKHSTSSDSELKHTTTGILPDISEDLCENDIEESKDDVNEDIFEMICDRVTRKCFYVKKDEVPKIELKRSNSMSKT